MADKTFDPNQFGGFVPGDVKRGDSGATTLSPARRRAAERAAQKDEAAVVLPTPTAPEPVAKPEKEKA